ncbi:D-lactate dehydrogenase [Ewingella americana]|uniref:D-lactate dehydrogenase n=1 Tax=Ewingella americana TaxID=41202 RepID=A0A377ND93_9GAMM|nr:D-lactate dehydrogenase [Ewingella americana]
MKLAVYSTKNYDRKYLELVNQHYGFELEFFDFLLTPADGKNSHRCRRRLYLRQ